MESRIVRNSRSAARTLSLPFTSNSFSLRGRFSNTTSRRIKVKSLGVIHD